MDAAFRLGALVLGISIEECGRRQASILSSDRLVLGKLSYVDMYRMGRQRSTLLQRQVDEHLEWLWPMLLKLEQQQSLSPHVGAKATV